VPTIPNGGRRLRFEPRNCIVLSLLGPKETENGDEKHTCRSHGELGGAAIELLVGMATSRSDFSSTPLPR
jgi:hypothetical protein